jgi:hypothetical protein
MDFQGSSTPSNANAVWSAAWHEVVAQNSSLFGNPPPDHTNKNHHLLIGWDNPDEGVGGWLAADYAGTFKKLVNTGGVFNEGTRIELHTFSTWYTNAGHRGVKQEGFITQTWTTNNDSYQIALTIVPQAGGTIQASFAPLQLVGGIG